MQLIIDLLGIYEIWVVVVVILSWIDVPLRYRRVLEVLARPVEVPMRWIRRLVPTRLGGLDFSPVVLIVAVEILRNVLLHWAARR